MKKSNSFITVGITGGIGAGKSIVGKVLNHLNYPVFYSDKEAKWLMNNDVLLKVQIQQLFGEQAYQADELNRSFLAEKVFHDINLKDQLNALVHPAVRKHFENWSFQQSSPIVFNEAAILFETGGYKQFDYTILVIADKAERTKRVMKRDKISEEAVLARMNNQWEDARKIPLADFIISNNPNDLVLPQILEILNQLSLTHQ